MVPISSCFSLFLRIVLPFFFNFDFFLCFLVFCLVFSADFGFFCLFLLLVFVSFSLVSPAFLVSGRFGFWKRKHHLYEHPSLKRMMVLVVGVVGMMMRMVMSHANATYVLVYNLT